MTQSSGDNPGQRDPCTLAAEACALLPLDVRNALEEVRTVHLVSGVAGLRSHLAAEEGSRTACAVVVARTEPASERPGGPCVIDHYSLHVVLHGRETTVLRVGDSIADVERSKLSGKLIIRKRLEDGEGPASVGRRQAAARVRATGYSCTSTSLS